MININKLFLFVIGFLRIITPFMVFFNPVYAILTALILDGIDSPVAYRSNLTWKQYTAYDKSLDLWWYLIILVYSVRFQLFLVFLILFLLRFVGQIYTILYRKHESLFWFPNVYENFFILYIFVLNFFPSLLNCFSGHLLIFPLIIAFITKLPQEYLLHKKGWFYSEKTWAKSITETICKHTL